MKPDSILTLPAQPTPYAVVGSPINHSLSPGMQQAAFDHEAIEARYYRIESDDVALETAVARMRQVPFGGWNCTIPNKVRMYQLCDRRAETAEQFRAVNTVVNEGGTLVGHNTDGVGWTRALKDALINAPSSSSPTAIPAARRRYSITSTPSSPQARSRARPRIFVPCAGSRKSFPPPCRKSTSSSTPRPPDSIPRRRRCYPHGSSPQT
jgi:Shikimate dehydrogenase substrate binding domain